MSNSNNQFAEWRPKPEEADRNIYWALNPKVELRISPIQGGGLFATQKIYAGELIWDDVRYANVTEWVESFPKGDRFVVHEEELDTWPADKQDFFLNYAYQVGPKTHYGPRTQEDFDADAAFVMNHSCDPNTWFVGDTKMTARRDIEPEEELTYDYATTDTIDHPWECGCGSDQCRGQILPTDWKLPELRERYGAAHFVTYIQRLFHQEDEERKYALAALASAAFAHPPPLVHCGLIRTPSMLQYPSRA